MILDSEYLGSIVDQVDAALDLAEDLDTRPVPCRIPTAVVWETFSGAETAGGRRAARDLRGVYEMLFAGRSMLPLSEGVARRAGTLNGKHQRSDQLATLDGVDSMVAAHGLALSEPVVSNDRDFQDVEGLEVVTY